VSFQNAPDGTGNQPGLPGAVQVRPSAAVGTAFLTQAFIWMFAGLLLTAAISALVSTNLTLLEIADQWFLPLIIGQLVLVVAIQAGIGRVSATVALGLFFVYAASLGLVVGLIVSLYTGESVGAAFLTASAMFGGAALYGATTKRSLAGLGGALSMALFGLIAALIVNLLLPNGLFGWIISLAGVILFTVLTAFDVQRIQAGDLVARTGSVEKAAVIGALNLYLDFVNLFLFLLRLMGGRR
jgi:FtsH-binding integral membrane protein